MITCDKQILIQQHLNMCYKIYEQYSWLINAYVSDFYVNNYWARIPQCWRDVLENLKPEILANVIDTTAPLHNFQVFPLSLLSLRESIKYLNLQRNQLNVSQSISTFGSLSNESILETEHFKNLFWKRVKSKKRHEIELIAKMCYKLGNETQCHYIVDVGSGLGHLDRILSYKYGLRVLALEAQEHLSTEASKLDNQMENTLKNNFNINFNKNFKVAHLNVKVKTNCDGDDILKAVKEAFGCDTDNIQFGIVGLHPCGDLGPTLLRLFKKSPQVKFINIVGCCFMKLTSLGYPISTYSSSKNYYLDYCAREVACHAIEAYVAKLKIGHFDRLKVHAYRAALEKLIITKQPSMAHSQICSVKCTSNDFTFSEYCAKALSNLDIEFTKEEEESKEIQEHLNGWRNVVVFYSLQLMIAPLIETTITLDWMLYILESGNQCEVTPVFNPHLSPRNQVLTAIK